MEAKKSEEQTTETVLRHGADTHEVPPETLDQSKLLF